MILKFNKGGIVKLQNAATTIPTYYNSGSTFEDAWERSQERWDTKKVIEAAEAKAAQRINEENKGFLNNMRFSGETGEWSKGADTNARMAKYVAEELGLDGNQAFFESYKKDGAEGLSRLLQGVGITLGAGTLAGNIGAYGLFGGIGTTVGQFAGSDALSWGGGKIGGWLDNRLGTNFFEPALSLAGLFKGWNVGAKYGYGAAKNILSKQMARQMNKYGNINIPKWWASDRMKTDIVNDAMRAGWRPKSTNNAETFRFKLPENTIEDQGYGFAFKQGGILKAQRGTGLAGIPIIENLAKKGFELVAKRSNGAQAKSIPTIIVDVITGRDKSFYNKNNYNGSNEIDTYLYGKPYNSEFTGDASLGPDYTNYINKNYPNKNIKTYNTHFGDTLYIDDKAKDLVEQQLNNNKVVGGLMGRYAHAPSYIVTTENGRPYDAGGHLIKFSKDENGNVVANMSDIYDFLPEDFNDKYDQTKNPSWTRNLANNIGTPFIVRQNNIPVVFKEIVPEYKTEKQKQLGDFLSQWGNRYDLKLPLRLSDKQIDEIFDGRDYGDDILDFMISKGYIKPVYKSGGILKGQHGILTPWYNLYNSKVGKFVRDSMFGKDYDLSDEEYVQKHGYAKPITGTGMLPGKTSMNAFEGVENLVKGSFGTGAKYNAGQQIMKTNAISKTVQPKTASNWDKFLKKSLDEQNKIVKYWDERYSTMRQLQANQKQFKRFVSWINKQ